LGYINYVGGLPRAKEIFAMCDYSLHSVRSRPAKIGDKLVTKDFGTGTRGFASGTDASTAVCVLPGAELAFASEVRHAEWTIRSLIRGTQVKIPHKTAIFRQINKGQEGIHRDALEFPDGQVVLLTRLCEGQEATVLQLPAEMPVAVEAKKRAPGLIVA
jgi:hypothetical protein